jgi:hypothetical protein
MKKYGLLDKIPSAFKKKSSLNEGGNEKNSTATGGEASESELPDVNIEYEGARK